MQIMTGLRSIVQFARRQAEMIQSIPAFLGTPTFKLFATFSLMFAFSTALLFAFIYWQTAVYEIDRIDNILVHDCAVLAKEPPDQRARAMSTRIFDDFRRVTFVALFDASGHRLDGNMAALPVDLKIDGQAHRVRVAREGSESEVEPIRAVAVRLTDGTVLVIGRNIEELDKLRDVVLRALTLGVVPASVLALLAGIYISRRTSQRVSEVHRSAERIMRGDLKERLPTYGARDDFDRLAASVNFMLDEISRLLESMKAVGDDIAHDLRTPLARLRARLERSRANTASHEDLLLSVDSAISDLDQAQTLVTTLLRIGEIESASRRSHFADIDLSSLVEEVSQIYQPISEEAGINLITRIEPGLCIYADRGLMLEAIANLVQNAIKFTPAGGLVTLALLESADQPIIRVTDNGPGIPTEEHQRVFERFYRLDKSRHIEGTGLGLNLVASIVKLHGFSVMLRNAEPGCVFEIICKA